MRERDWLAEDAALAAARSDLQDARRNSVVRDVDRLRHRVNDLDTARKRRAALVSALTKAVPGAHYREVRADDIEAGGRRTRSAARKSCGLETTRIPAEPRDRSGSENERTRSHARVDPLAPPVHTAPVADQRATAQADGDGLHGSRTRRHAPRGGPLCRLEQQAVEVVDRHWS